MPEVTVVIPTLNRWRLLSTGALRSALAQEDVDLEVIVVNDGSTDETAAGLESIVDVRVRVIHHEKPQGLARARNAGMGAARSNWIAFLDDDDLWAPWKLRTQLDLAATAEATFIYSPALYVTDGEVRLEPAIDPGELTPKLLAGEGAIPAGGSNVMVRTEAIRQVGGFDEEITHLGDFDCWIRLDPICRAARCPEPLLAYVQHPTGMHLRNSRLVPSDVRHIYRKYQAQYEVLGRQFDGETFVIWIAHQHQSAGRLRQAANVYLMAAWHYRSLRHLARGAALLPGRRVRALARPLVRWIRGQKPGSSTGSESAEATEPDRTRPAPAWLTPYLDENS